ncbi:chromosomal protein MC1 [Halobacteriales archaeon QS_1_68_20]|nr:MAG: chromosomal protein MC1 [Halobacteriales archaeon QS_1_68_20]
MTRDDGKRDFALREGDDESVFSGNTPRHAALKAARRLDPASDEESARAEEIRLREKGTSKVHVYEGWAWEEDAPDDAPDWMPGEVTEANVSKKGIELEDAG